MMVTDGVSLSVPRRQALGIIGPNGAGKSTLFNLITGNFAPDTGRITFFGAGSNGLSGDGARQDGVGRLFQILQPFECLTAFENLLVAASFRRGKSEAAMTEDCAAILKRTELIRRANMPAGTLFGVDSVLNPGEIVVTIGANGAGKTTSLRSIAEVLRNGVNQVRHWGDAIGALLAEAVGGGDGAQGRKLFPSLTVKENPLIRGQMRRVVGYWALRTVNALFPILRERRLSPGMALSGGQQQMVAI